VTTAAYAPVRLSIVPSLVPRELLSSAIGINSVVFNLSRLAGPAVGGVVLVAFGPAWAFYINAMSYLPLLGALMLVSMRPTERMDKAGGFVRQLLDGLAFARARDVIWWQLILIGWAALFGRSILELLPVYADRIYAKGAVALGLLSGAAGAGALIAALSVSHLALSPRQLERGTILLTLLMGVALIALTLSDALVFGLVQVALIGFGATGSTILSQTLVQLEVTDPFRGRVSSLWGMASLGGMSFGGLILGGMLERLDVHKATLITGLVTLAVPMLALVRRRSRA
jgi:MFS family permease